jgi:hypothetical protein
VSWWTEFTDALAGRWPRQARENVTREKGAVLSLHVTYDELESLQVWAHSKGMLICQAIKDEALGAAAVDEFTAASTPEAKQ